MKATAGRAPSTSKPSGKIVFESGPFDKFKAELLSGQRIGMNDNGSRFYNLTCDPKSR